MYGILAYYNNFLLSTPHTYIYFKTICHEPKLIINCIVCVFCSRESCQGLAYITVIIIVFALYNTRYTYKGSWNSTALQQSQSKPIVALVSRHWSDLHSNRYALTTKAEDTSSFLRSQLCIKRSTFTVRRNK